MKFICIILCAMGTSLFGQYSDSFGWTFFDTLNRSLKSNMVNDIIFEKQGTAWVTTQNRVLQKYSSGKWKSYKLPLSETQYPGVLFKMTLLPDHVIAITGIPGLLIYFNTVSANWTYISTPDKIQFIHIACNSSGALVLGCMSGLYQYQKGKFQVIHKGSEDVMGMHLDSSNNLLVGFRKGLYSFTYADGKYQNGQKLADFSCYDAFYFNDTLWASSFSYLQLHSKARNDTNWQIHTRLPQSIFYNYNGSWQYCIHRIITWENQITLATQFDPHIAVMADSGWVVHTVPIWLRDQTPFDGINVIRQAPDGSLWIGTWHHGIAVLSEGTKYYKIPWQPKRIEQKRQNVQQYQQQLYQD